MGGGVKPLRGETVRLRVCCHACTHTYTHTHTHTNSRRARMLSAHVHTTSVKITEYIKGRRKKAGRRRDGAKPDGVLRQSFSP